MHVPAVLPQDAITDVPSVQVNISFRARPNCGPYPCACVDVDQVAGVTATQVTETMHACFNLTQKVDSGVNQVTRHRRHNYWVLATKSQSGAN